ncbi:hypothetical protein BU17DRAFT_61682 [Hysterangium stoloniferum]|nr:hypothetical protein BU17DRAFT_61682 [Hysterangium stoloniferum]
MSLDSAEKRKSRVLRKSVPSGFVVNYRRWSLFTPRESRADGYIHRGRGQYPSSFPDVHLATRRRSMTFITTTPALTSTSTLIPSPRQPHIRLNKPLPELPRRAPTPISKLTTSQPRAQPQLQPQFQAQPSSQLTAPDLPHRISSQTEEEKAESRFGQFLSEPQCIYGAYGCSELGHPVNKSGARTRTYVVTQTLLEQTSQADINREFSTGEDKNRPGAFPGCHAQVHEHGQRKLKKRRRESVMLCSPSISDMEMGVDVVTGDTDRSGYVSGTSVNVPAVGLGHNAAGRREHEFLNLEYDHDDACTPYSNGTQTPYSYSHHVGEAAPAPAPTYTSLDVNVNVGIYPRISDITIQGRVLDIRIQCGTSNIIIRISNQLRPTTRTTFIQFPAKLPQTRKINQEKASDEGGIVVIAGSKGEGFLSGKVGREQVGGSGEVEVDELEKPAARFSETARSQSAPDFAHTSTLCKSQSQEQAQYTGFTSASPSTQLKFQVKSKCDDYQSVPHSQPRPQSQHTPELESPNDDLTSTPHPPPPSFLRTVSNRRWTVAVSDASEEALLAELERLRSVGWGLGWSGELIDHAHAHQKRERLSGEVGEKGEPGEGTAEGQEEEPERCEWGKVETEAWLSARQALMVCREIVRTETTYREGLEKLRRGETLTNPPPLLLQYLPALVTASEALSMRFADDPSAWGVSLAFLGVQELLESAFVAWSGIVGELFHPEGRRRGERTRRLSLGAFGAAKSSKTPKLVKGALNLKDAPTQAPSRLILEDNPCGRATEDVPPSSPTKESCTPTSTAPGEGARTLSTWRERSSRSMVLRKSRYSIGASSSTTTATGMGTGTGTGTVSGSIGGKVPSVEDLAIQPTQRVMRYVLLSVKLNAYKLTRKGDGGKSVRWRDEDCAEV